MTHTRHGRFETSIGQLLLVAAEGAIIGVYFQPPKYAPNPEAIGDDLGVEPADPVLARAARELREYLAGERHEFDFDIELRGDAFSLSVWELLRETRFGETTNYGAIAERLGNRALAQRVGQAVGHNPIMIAVACHRVLGADGSLVGYAGGLDRKRTLLTLEEPDAAEAGRLF